MNVALDADADLVEALRRDAPAAVAELVERHGTRLYRLAVRITGVTEDAEAAVETALATALREIDTFEGESFGSWLDRVAASAAYAKRRARQRHSGEIAVEDVVPALDGAGRHFEPMDDWSNRIDERALDGDLRRVLADAIDALPADYRTALVLHDVEGMASPDIAETLDVGLPAAKSRVHVSRLFVRQRLSEYLTSR